MASRVMLGSTDDSALEQFAALSNSGTAHGFVGRMAGIDVSTDRKEALHRLDAGHQRIRRVIGLGERLFSTAEQVHGAGVANLLEGRELPPTPVEGVDALITNRADVCLGIYVADCCAVYLVDPVRRAVGLVHSGKKGTELGIVPLAIERMGVEYGTLSRDLIVQLSPCIRPPWYETDFAAEIRAQCRELGVEKIADEGVCTAAIPTRYYSYRREKGRTGRMLALLALV